MRIFKITDDSKVPIITSVQPASWVLVYQGGQFKKVSYGNLISGAFQTVANIRQDLTSPSTTTYPSTQAVADAISGLATEITLTDVQDQNTGSTAYVSGRRIWQWVSSFITKAWQWTAKQTLSGGLNLGGSFLNKFLTTNGSGDVIGTDIARAQITMTGNATATNVLANNVYVKVEGITTASFLTNTTAPTNNRIVFGVAGTYLVSAYGIYTGTNNTNYRFRLAINGTPIGIPSGGRPVTNNQDAGFSLSAQYITVNANDFLELFVTCTNAGNDPTISEMCITCRNSI